MLAFSADFQQLDSWHCPYLKHCQAITIWERTLYLLSSAYDSVLGFNLDEQRFHWAIHLLSARFRFSGRIFDPLADDGPLLLEKLQLNSLHCNEHGMYISGHKTGGMLHFNGEAVNMAVQLPAKSNDARPFRDGVLFNDYGNDVLRYTGRGEGDEDRAMAVPGFARGLCVLNDRLVAGGSAPATLTLYDLAANRTLASVRLSEDERSTIHSIALAP